jgi:hypothetical protein
MYTCGSGVQLASTEGTGDSKNEGTKMYSYRRLRSYSSPAPKEVGVQGLGMLVQSDSPAPARQWLPQVPLSVPYYSICLGVHRLAWSHTSLASISSRQSTPLGPTSSPMQSDCPAWWHTSLMASSLWLGTPSPPLPSPWPPCHPRTVGAHLQPHVQRPRVLEGEEQLHDAFVNQAVQQRPLPLHVLHHLVPGLHQSAG